MKSQWIRGGAHFSGRGRKYASPAISRSELMIGNIVLKRFWRANSRRVTVFRSLGDLAPEKNVSLAEYLKKSKPVGLPIIHQLAAGIDIGSRLHVVALAPI